MDTVTGLHNLQHYAMEFWFHHLIQYAQQIATRGDLMPVSLISLLNQLLISCRKSEIPSNLASMLKFTDLEQIANQVSILRHIPSVMDLVYDIMKLRTILTKKEYLEKSVQGTFSITSQCSRN